MISNQAQRGREGSGAAPVRTAGSSGCTGRASRSILALAAGCACLGSLAARGEWTISSAPEVGSTGGIRGLLTEWGSGLAGAGSGRSDTALRRVGWTPGEREGVAEAERQVFRETVRLQRQQEAEAFGVFSPTRAKALLSEVVALAGVVGQGQFPGGSGDGATLFEVQLGTIHLEREQAGQWVTLQVRNLSDQALSVSGLNLNLQVADTGPASEGGRGVINGPNIQAVELGVGTLFDGNHTGTQSGGGSAQAGQWSVTTASGPVLVGAKATVSLARVQFTTMGLPAEGGSWPLTLSLAFPADPESYPTSLVGSLGEEWVVGSTPGTLVVVPEPWAIGGFAAGGLAVFAGVRRLIRRRGAGEVRSS